jgi:uroporphyrinogen-III synthase
VSRALGGSCSMPLAAHAVWQGDELVLDAALGDASEPRARCCAPAAAARPAEAAAATALGEQARAAALRDAGAGRYLAAALAGGGMRAIVTRPAAQAGLGGGAAGAGRGGRSLPLIGIAAGRSGGRAGGLAPLPAMALVMFVSANAVQHFFARAARRRLAGRHQGRLHRARHGGGAAPPACRRTARRARPRAGPFDSEALWLQLARWPWAGRQVLVVRGEAGRDWLAEKLRARRRAGGFRGRLPPAGRPPSTPRPPPCWPPRWPRRRRTCWHFSSSEAIAHLVAACPRTDWAPARALATHPRIAQAARQQGFGRVDEVACTRRTWRRRWPPEPDRAHGGPPHPRRRIRGWSAL